MFSQCGCEPQAQVEATPAPGSGEPAETVLTSFHPWPDAAGDCTSTFLVDAAHTLGKGRSNLPSRCTRQSLLRSLHYVANDLAERCWILARHMGILTENGACGGGTRPVILPQRRFGDDHGKRQ